MKRVASTANVDPWTTMCSFHRDGEISTLDVFPGWVGLRQGAPSSSMYPCGVDGGHILDEANVPPLPPRGGSSTTYGAIDSWFSTFLL